MKRLNRNSQVIEAWKGGHPARNSRGTFYTDGENLWSYQVKIAKRLPNEAIILADFTAKSNSFLSQTTSCHVGLVRRGGVDLVMHPQVWKASMLSRETVPF